MEDPETTSDTQLTKEPDAAAKERAAALIGRVISQRYRIVELLAMGGMGAVYRGEHLLLKKRLAIKILHPEIENLPELVSRFEREAIAGAHVQHANVAAATDFGELEDGSFFLVLELIRGNTLHHAMKKGRFEPQRAVNIVRQIAAALGAVHAMGIVHRDVKPRNVMLLEGEADVAKLIDFGLAKVPVDDIAESRRSSALDEAERLARSNRNSEGDRITDVGVIFGTIAYLAPEAALGMDAVDERADLYALGVILYEMLAGVHLFEATDPVELFKAQRYTPPPPFAERVPGLSIPAALEAVVMRLLEKDPAARFQTGEELIKALDEALAPPEEARSSPPPRGDAPTEPALEDLSPALTAPTSEAWATPPPQKVATLPTAVRSKVRVKVNAPAPAPPSKRRAPYVEVALLIAVAVVGLFMFTRLRFQPHTSPKPPPASPSSAPTTPSAPRAALEPASSAAPAPQAVPSGATDPAGAPTSAPDALSGVDAAGLRVLLSRAVRTREWRDGEAALLALVERDPSSFSRGDVVTAVREVVAGLEHDGQADKVFEALSSRLGNDGLDVLYEIVQAKGGSRAAARAAELLRKDPVRARETPALRIAFELREASCVDKLKLLDRTVQDGDGRALMVLEAQGLACFKKSREVEQAITDLRAKLSKR